MSRSIDYKNTFALLTALALLLAMLGCSSDSDLTAISDADVSTDVSIAPPPGAIKILPGKNADPRIQMGEWDYSGDDNFYEEKFVELEEAVVEEISVRGGKITNGIVTLIFPEGALTRDVDITLQMDPSGLLIFECGPHGLQFNAPVKIELNLEGTNYENMAKQVDVKWWDSANKKWVKIRQIRDKNNNTPRAVLWHFSKYSGVGG